MPKISVIIPAYNVAPYIGETLTSVFAQTFNGYEVILINDGSPDTEALELALEPYLSQVTYLKQANLGASAARNAGLQAASGEFIAFLDADDVWLPSYLQEQLAFIEECKCDLVCADAMHFGGSPFDGHSYMEVFMDETRSNGVVTFIGLVRDKQSLITSGVVARRDAIFKAGLFDRTLRNSQDFDLWLRMARNGSRLAYQRKVLLRYRYHANSLSGDALNRVMRELRVFQNIIDSYDLRPDERVEIDRAIKRIQRELNLVEGKAHLESGEFAEARESFRKADELKPSLKLKTARLLLRISPGLLRSLHLRRPAHS
jgi:glycosyltransferase involved in cell wall biosynthesis